METYMMIQFLIAMFCIAPFVYSHNAYCQHKSTCNIPQIFVKDNNNAEISYLNHVIASSAQFAQEIDSASKSEPTKEPMPCPSFSPIELKSPHKAFRVSGESSFGIKHSMPENASVIINETSVLSLKNDIACFVSIEKDLFTLDVSFYLDAITTNPETSKVHILSALLHRNMSSNTYTADAFIGFGELKETSPIKTVKLHPIETYGVVAFMKGHQSNILTHQFAMGTILRAPGNRHIPGIIFAGYMYSEISNNIRLETTYSIELANTNLFQFGLFESSLESVCTISPVTLDNWIFKLCGAVSWLALSKTSQEIRQDFVLWRLQIDGTPRSSSFVSNMSLILEHSIVNVVEHNISAETKLLSTIEFVHNIECKTFYKLGLELRMQTKRNRYLLFCEFNKRF